MELNPEKRGAGTLPEGFGLHEAGLGDYFALSRLERVCFREDAWSVLDMVPVLTDRRIFRRKLIQIEDQKLIGFVAVELNTDEKTGFLLTIGVDPNCQRRGLGRYLLQISEDACRAAFTGGRLKLTVNVENHNAIALYRKFDYRTVGWIRDYYGEGRSAYLMEKAL